MKYAKIPSATITRLSLYSRTLENLLAEDTKIISSERLATLCDHVPLACRFESLSSRRRDDDCVLLVVARLLESAGHE